MSFRWTRCGIFTQSNAAQLSEENELLLHGATWVHFKNILNKGKLDAEEYILKNSNCMKFKTTQN